MLSLLLVVFVDMVAMGWQLRKRVKTKILILVLFVIVTKTRVTRDQAGLALKTLAYGITTQNIFCVD